MKVQRSAEEAQHSGAYRSRLRPPGAALGPRQEGFQPARQKGCAHTRAPGAAPGSAAGSRRAPSVAESSWRKAGPSQHSRCAARSHLAPRTTKPRWLLWLLQSPQHQPSLRCFNRRFISFHLIPYLPDAEHCISKVTNGNFQSWFFPTTMFSKTTFSGFVLKITPTLQNRKAQKAIRVWVC